MRAMRLAPALLAAMVFSVSLALPPAAVNGDTWQPLTTGVTVSLRGLHAVDENIVWAAGSNGTVLRTTDGGRTWSSFSAGAGLELRDVHALDAKTAYVLAVSEPAAILRTTDGGETWAELYRSPHPEAFLDSFTFLDRNRAIVFGDPVDGAFLILTTDDGGATWKPAADIPAAHTGEAAFAASGTCVVSVGGRAWIGTGGLSSRVLRSTDGGRTWQAVTTPMISGEPTTGIYSVAFGHAGNGVLVGGDYTKPEETTSNAAFTTDGGKTWRGVAEGSRPRGQRAAAAWVPGQGQTVMAVGRTGTDLSRDGGRTWSPLSEQGYYALSFAPGGEGYAVGADGRAARLRWDPDKK